MARTVGVETAIAGDDPRSVLPSRTSDPQKDGFLYFSFFNLFFFSPHIMFGFFTVFVTLSRYQERFVAPLLSEAFHSLQSSRDRPTVFD